MRYHGRVPNINLKNISNDIPIAILVGKQDTLADKQDVDRLVNELGNRVMLHKEYDNFDHEGFSVA